MLLLLLLNGGWLSDVRDLEGRLLEAEEEKGRALALAMHFRRRLTQIENERHGVVSEDDDEEEEEDEA